MKICEPKFELSAVRPEQFPASNISEIAFVGRSNVGKSSIINVLLNRKSLARVGSRPGMTRMINFFNIDDNFYLVDLPGYGYASVSHEKKRDWAFVIENYLKTRLQLKLLLLLVDIRHTPTKDDCIMLDWIRTCAVSYIVVATKHDKIPRNKLQERIKNIKETLMLLEDENVVTFSSETKHGKEELLQIIESFI